MTEELNLLRQQSKQLDRLLTLIIYGDIHEVPLTVISDHYDRDKFEKMDLEQQTRLHVAATVKEHLSKELENLS